MEIAIAYWTGYGHTRRLAEHVAEGVTRSGAQAHLIDVATLGEGQWQVLDQAAAIIFGAPTYMGSTAAGFKAFMDETSDRWGDQVWADKIAAGFSVATYPSGDKLITLTQLAVFAAQHGMIWVGLDAIGERGNPEDGALNPDGYCLGLGARSSRDKSLLIDPGDAETARLFGARVAMAAQRWARRV